jgi:CHAT domain-containing protein/Tfp pilus assembly protein PilF
MRVFLQVAILVLTSVGLAVAVSATSVSAQTWSGLLQKADSLSKVRQDDAAIALGTEALKAATKRFGTKDSSVALILHRLGVYNHRKGAQIEAESKYIEALAMRREVLEPNHLDIARTLNNLGALYRDMARYSEADSVLRDALAVKRATLGRDHISVGNTVNNLASLYEDLGRYAEAESLFAQALAIKAKHHGSESPEVARVVLALGRIHHRRGRLGEAEPYYKQAIDTGITALGSQSPHVAAFRINLALLYLDMGRFLESESLLRQNLPVMEEHFGSVDYTVALALNNLGLVCLHRGNYIDAVKFLERALEARIRLYGREHPQVAQTMDNIAHVHRRHGKLDEAEELCRQALTIRRSIYGEEAHPFVADNLSNLAMLHVSRLDYAAAERLQEEALRIRREFYGSKHPDVADEMSDLAVVCARQGKQSEADSLIAECLSIQKECLEPGHPGFAKTFGVLADFAAAKDRSVEAESLYLHAIAIWEQSLGRDHLSVARVLERLSRLYRHESNNTEALAAAGRAASIRLKDFSSNGIALSGQDRLKFSGFLKNSVDQYLSCYFACPDGPDTAGAIGLVLSSKGQVADGLFEQARVLASEPDSTTVALLAELRYAKFQVSQLFVGSLADSGVHARIDKADSLSRAARELETKLARISAEYRKYKEYGTVTSGGISDGLTDDGVLVEYLKYNQHTPGRETLVPRYLVIVIAGDGEVVLDDIGEAATIDSLVSRYRGHMLEMSSRQHLPLLEDRDEYTSIAQALYGRLLLPVERHLNGKRIVFVAPDGSLNLVSFAGLVGSDGRYVVENAAVHYLTSGRDLIRLQRSEPVGNGLLALGDPDYDAGPEMRLAEVRRSEPIESSPAISATRGLRSGCIDQLRTRVDRLPHTRKEVETVSEYWVDEAGEPATYYLGPAASEDNVKAESSGKRAIHLATHGYFLGSRCLDQQDRMAPEASEVFVGENPLLQSGLLFAGSNLGRETPDTLGLEDGTLTAHEVSALNLIGTESVVLSACETGLGEVEEGEGVFGLRLAFQIAGARTVVSALWPVSDRTSGEMMVQLYSQSGQSLPDRLRAMQLSQIDKLRAEGLADHPYLWAGFIAIGGWE